MRVRTSSLLALLALLALAPSAGAAEAPSAAVVDSVAWKLRVDTAHRADCRTTARRSSVATRKYRAPVAGVFHARLAGKRGDWDLTVIDAASRRVLGASLGFGAREVVSVPVAAGDRLLLRGCRRSGSGSTARLAAVHATWPELRAPEKMTLVEVDVSGPQDQAKLLDLGLDTADHSDGRTLMIVLHGPGDAAKLVQAGYVARTLVADVAADDRRQRLAERRRAMSGAPSPLPSGREEYRTLADHQADMKELADKYPDLVRGFVFPGTSLEGREISGVEVATGVKRTDDGRPHIYIDGVNHAREWPAGEIPIEFAIDLVENPKNDPRLKAILDGARTFVVPIVNVDGFEVSRTAGTPGVFETANVGDLPWAATGTGAAYKRKNCKFADNDVSPVPCLAAQFLNDMGVDTNRNYGYGWGGPGASNIFLQLTYRGPAPFSEPETTALRKFVMGLQPALVVSTHTVAALMLRPPGQEETPDTPDEEPMKALGDAMAAETGYTSQRSWELYDTTGTTLDFTYQALGSWSYTPELDGEGFHADHPGSVVDQYEGSGGRGGMREALIKGGTVAMSPESHSVVAGRAPAGRTLRLSRQVLGKTWQGDALDPDVHTSSITVPASGRYEWHVMPSRRPYETTGKWTLTCEKEGKVVETREVAVERGHRADVDLACGEIPVVPAPQCLELLRDLKIRVKGRGISVSYASTPATVTVEVTKGKRKVAVRRAGRRGTTIRSLRNGRYVVRVAAITRERKRDVRVATITKRGKRLRVSALRKLGGC